MRSLVVLHSDPDLLHAVRQLAPQDRCLVASDWSGVRAAVRDAPPDAIVVLDPFHGREGIAPGYELRAFLSEFPYLPVIAAFATRNRPRELVQFARWGIADVISLDLERPAEALRQRVLEAEHWALRRLVQRSSPAGIGSAATALLLASTEVVCRKGDAEDLARDLGVTRRTVTRWFGRAKLPPHAACSHGYACFSLLSSLTIPIDVSDRSR